MPGPENSYSSPATRLESPVRTDSPTKMRRPRLRKRGALLFFYQPNV